MQEQIDEFNQRNRDVDLGRILNGLFRRIQMLEGHVDTLNKALAAAQAVLRGDKPA